MKTYKNRWIKTIINVLFIYLCFGIVNPLFLSISTPLQGRTDEVIIPGDVNRICYYANFFYNYPSEDFLYYFNEFLLSWEKPDETVMTGGLRHRLMEVVSWHDAIKEFIRFNTGERKDRITFNLKDAKAYQKASDFLLILGRKLNKNAKGQYYLTQIDNPGMPDYLGFALIRKETLEQQINNTQFFNFYLRESKVPLPHGLDLEFFREVTGIPVNASSFFENLLKNERLSLLMGVLCRLSANEIQYINNLVPPPRPGAYDAWKKIYNNKKLLMGLFVLSNALRVQKARENRENPVLQLPGGEAAESFWSQMVGGNSKLTSFAFLEHLATKDEGKLNYLYVFSYFLPEDKRRILFFNYDAQKVKEIYDLIDLDRKEKLSENEFPLLGNWNFFTLMYVLKTKDEEIYFPQGINAWFQVVARETSASASLLDILKVLVKRPENIRTFMAIYSKFSHRPRLLANGNLRKLYNLYEGYNAMMDFIEKIPIKKPETVSALLDWVQRLEQLTGKDSLLFTSIYQSLFEILAFTGKYAPDRFDYDGLVSELIQLPLTRPDFYHRVFRFFQNSMGISIDKKGKTLVDAMLSGIPNPTIMIKSENARYRFLIKEAFRKTIVRILQSQEICSFSHFQEIHRLLARGMQVKPPATASLGGKINEAFAALPHPGMSGDAPRKIRSRVTPYSRSNMEKKIQDFVEKIHMGANREELENIMSEIKGDYLIYNLRDHLLGLVYAVNAKDPDIRAFFNPNFVRLHDIASNGGRTSWDCYRKRKSRKPGTFAEYHLDGPLSRLNITFASRWQTHLFRGKILRNPAFIRAIISNLMEFYPMPLVGQSMVYNAQLVELGFELLRESQYNANAKDNNEIIRQDVINTLNTITAGHHYRRTMEYLAGKTNHHNLYLSEIKKLGEIFFQTPQLQQRKYVKELSAMQKMGPFKKFALSDRFRREMHRFGGVYSYIFGSLMPRNYPVFPQETANLLESGWFRGSMIDEYKIKLSYHLYKKEIPPCLLGQFLYMYLMKTGRQFLRQNHANDYPTIYFVFDIFNNAHLNGMIKQLKKEGYLKLR
jgi:hypothetical protein